MSVLVTGATGFLGGHLCALLLRSEQVCCVVRGRTDQGAEARLRAHLTRLGGPFEPERLTVVRGDLSRPRMGLPAAVYTRLAERVETVYHCAATVNLAASCEHLVPGNVTATREVVRFARHRRTKALHHVSSVAVFAAARELGCAEVDEATEPILAMSGGLGYGQSKFHGEEQVRLAAAEGLPVTVYRPGAILGHSRDWQFSDTDLWTRLVRAAVEVGAAPDSPATMPGAPVDHTAAMIVELSRSSSAAGRVFHPNYLEPIRVGDVFDRVRAAGCDLPAVDPADWKQALLRHAHLPASGLVLACWAGIAYMVVPEPRYLPPCSRARLTTSVAPLPEPALDEAYFARMLAGIAERGHIPKINQLSNPSSPP
ncbi:NAD-dependent epimerase/dehydratase family protein [Nonomuraea sp. PA05]|uniref:thioester reductase domain-containing protein n=1 Tax=Nonomuraea sp. PA05 TaxID=2604466 RepID=UPI0011D8B354|nr:thioester reductase domain-containing protein [Nonomuraea sp. PA05]TYB57636.1 NAD-dependent epimerase/dehydratase family protein [Nonomuraea sp. PA05]